MIAYMKKLSRKIIVSCLALVLLAVALIFLFMFYNREKFPFKDLQASKVASVSINSLSNTQQADLSADEIAELIGHLKNVVLKSKGNQEFLDYSDSRYRMFTIRFSDGTTLDFSASSPFYIFDGEKGYQANLTVCEEIAQFYYNLVKSHFD